MRVISTNTKTAVVLFNLGGPDSLQAVRPFLFNLFNDPAIIALPRLFRKLLAGFISKKRTPKAQAIYAQIGNASPILPNTLAQARALEETLNQYGNVKLFTCMRYWHPMSEEIVKEVEFYRPDHIILLPLYPQFSTTTSASSAQDWKTSCAKQGLNIPTTLVCCYPTQPKMVQAHAVLIHEVIKQMPAAQP